MKCYVKDYPRPQFVRDNWENLNGIWDFAFDDDDCGEVEQWYERFPKQREICVPFSYETKMSGIGEEQSHNQVWYHKTMEIDAAKLEGNRFVIHFEGSDFETKLWVNGRYAGMHRGGYARFSFDITKLVKDGANEFAVKVSDSFDRQQPRGKQRWIGENFECWYVQTTGIWKTVWTEYVPKVSLSSVKMTPDLEEYALRLEFDVDAPEVLFDGSLALTAEISYQGTLISRVPHMVFAKHMAGKIDMNTGREDGYAWECHLWSPQSPNLYDIEFVLEQNGRVIDRIGSYFAMREIKIDGTNILLNGRPLYQRLILDQGYWKDSHLTPPSEDALIEDIDKIHALGYNGLRKHQKTEDERFLYWCDVKGMLVWSEVPAAYQFTDYAVTEFMREWSEIVQQNYNHPCIITWTPFNESWGINRVKEKRDQQHFTEAVYHLTKSLDPFRPVIVNDGWEHTVSDIITLHDYEEAGEVLKDHYINGKEQILAGEIPHNESHFAFAKGYQYKGQPVILSEFGGIAFDNEQKGWGYGNKVKSEKEFIQRFSDITSAIKEIPYVCGYCYTQVSDVQQEINGLLTEERQYKVNPEVIKEINLRKADGRRG